VTDQRRRAAASADIGRQVATYGRFLELVAEQYEAAIRKSGASCLTRCHICCTGFFGVSLLDALHLRKNIRSASPAVKRTILARARKQLKELEAKDVFSLRSPLLRTAAALDRIARRSAGMRCPCLGDDDRCMLYMHRPLLCRTFGPAVKTTQRSVVMEGCGHIRGEVQEADFPILSIYRDEDVLLRSLFKKLGIDPRRRIETIIPAALVMDLAKWV
jgi:Fe-S-cluster containining protein